MSNNTCLISDIKIVFVSITRHKTNPAAMLHPHTTMLHTVLDES